MYSKSSFTSRKAASMHDTSRVNSNFKNAILETEPLTYVIHWRTIANHTTLDLGHWQFTVRYTPHLRFGVYLLQTSTIVSSIGIFYTNKFH